MTRALRQPNGKNLPDLAAALSTAESKIRELRRERDRRSGPDDDVKDEAASPNAAPGKDQNRRLCCCPFSAIANELRGEARQLRPQGTDFSSALRFSSNRRQPSNIAATVRAFPSKVLGPVESRPPFARRCRCEDQNTLLRSRYLFAPLISRKNARPLTASQTCICEFKSRPESNRRMLSLSSLFHMVF
jgi:hypothetical protein